MSSDPRPVRQILAIEPTALSPSPPATTAPGRRTVLYTGALGPITNAKQLCTND
jgi:hypothetical protein